MITTWPVLRLGEAELKAVLQGFIGDQYQLPPTYSAIKIGGVPSTRAPRRGEEVEREPRFVRVVSWELMGPGAAPLDFRMRVSKGTYVRTLAHDLGSGWAGAAPTSRRSAAPASAPSGFPRRSRSSSSRRSNT